MYGIIKKAKYLGLGLTMFCLISLTAVPAFSQDNGFGVQEASAELKQDQLKEIGIVPNPYKGASIYERSQLIDEVRFTNLLAEQTTVRIFTLNGSLIREMEKPAGSRTLTWNLTTENNLPIASGVYLVHLDVAGVGETVVKFAVVRKQTQLDVF